MAAATAAAATACGEEEAAAKARAAAPAMLELEEAVPEAEPPSKSGSPCAKEASSPVAPATPATPCATELADRIALLPKGWRGALLQLLQEAEADAAAEAAQAEVSDAAKVELPETAGVDELENGIAPVAAGGGAAAIRARRAMIASIGAGDVGRPG
eukprot:TRINITY_DN14015_c0_g1_i1.p1 TRINITY_DN14015_c0_g1~~TRINITY_DN14015_c0_g1_i1.p1  ORF type:complete len:168 (-),score=72.59 TRINITY_DN14015_c0_g1_i1:106-576(-)